jgi:hypothetical protein
VYKGVWAAALATCRRAKARLRGAASHVIVRAVTRLSPPYELVEFRLIARWPSTRTCVARSRRYDDDRPSPFAASTAVRV